jgi:hypothetical protein
MLSLIIMRKSIGTLSLFVENTHIISRHHVPNLGATSVVVVDAVESIVLIVPTEVSEEHPHIQHGRIDAGYHVVVDCKQRNSSRLAVQAACFRSQGCREINPFFTWSFD